MASKKKSKTRKPRNQYIGAHPRPDCGGRIQIGWNGVNPKTGKWEYRRALLQTTDLGEALIEKARREQAERGGPPQPIEGLTLRQFAERYIRACEQKAEKDIRTKKQRMRVVLDELGDLPLTRFTPQQFRDFHNSFLVDAKTKEEKLQRKKTANRYLALIKSMIRWAKDERLLPEEVYGTVKLAKMFKEGKGRKRFFYLSEALRLVKACPDPRAASPDDGFLRPMVLLALGTGMRLGDLVELRWQDVDEKGEIVWVDDDTKGDEGYEVPLGGIARLGLEEARAWLKANGRDPGDETYVIDWRSRDRLLYLYRRAFPKVRTKAGLKSTQQFKLLRDSFCTWTQAHGEYPRDVQHWMGHASLETTELYSHPTLRAKKNKDTINPVDPGSGVPFRMACKLPVAQVVAMPSTVRVPVAQSVDGAGDGQVGRCFHDTGRDQPPDRRSEERRRVSTRMRARFVARKAANDSDTN